MGQDEIVKMLERSEFINSARQISEALKDNFEKISKQLRKLDDRKEIMSIELNRIQASKYLDRDRIFRRMKFYYVLPVSVDLDSL